MGDQQMTRSRVLVTMTTSKREALWTIVCLLTVSLTAMTSAGSDNTSSVSNPDFSSDRARDGSCFWQQENCAEGATCTENEDLGRFICYCPQGYEGNGYKEGSQVPDSTGCKLPADIEPNCEKYYQAGADDSHYYVIDPDGPSGNSKGNLEPFRVQCDMAKNYGVTVINNYNGQRGLDLSAGPHTIQYLAVTTQQVGALKDRSSGCVQDITFIDCTNNAIDVSEVKYNGGKSLKDLMSDICADGVCQCEIAYSLQNMEDLPILDITGKDATVIIGPLRCVEIFPNCAASVDFVKAMGAKREATTTRGTLTIDPDGTGGEAPFVARCVGRETIITRPGYGGSPSIKVHRGDPPHIRFWNLTYTDHTGNPIGESQLTALMDRSEHCSQMLELRCTNAVATGKVFYKNYDDVQFTNLVSAEVNSTCSCGVTGTCDGGPDAQCNCDTSGHDEVKDEMTILDKGRLPVCEVCMELDPIRGSGVDASYRTISFNAGEIRCGRRPGDGQ